MGQGERLVFPTKLRELRIGKKKKKYGPPVKKNSKKRGFKLEGMDLVHLKNNHDAVEWTTEYYYCVISSFF